MLNRPAAESDDKSDNRCQEHIGCSYAYKIALCDDRLCKTVQTYQWEKTVYKFVAKTLTESDNAKRLC